MVSTHYNELKNYAYHTEGIENGHVEFDERTLRPTYRLNIGVAGSSHALSIAARLGLPTDIVNKARDYKSSFESSDMEEVLSELNEQLRRTKDRERALKKELDEARRMKGNLERERKAFNEKKKQVLQKAQEDAENLKRSIRLEGEQIIKDLKNQFSEANKAKRQDAVARARKGTSGIVVPQLVDDDRKALTIQDVKVGSSVYVSSLRSLGTILAIKGNRLNVDVNGLTATVKIDDVKSTTREEVAKEERDTRNRNKVRTKKGKPVTQVVRQQMATTELNIIGQTVDEGVMNVSRFIDQALLAGISQVRIIHGKGTGVLRDGVQAYLKTLPQVSKYEMAGYTEGGAGATNVYLK